MSLEEELSDLLFAQSIRRAVEMFTKLPDGGEIGVNGLGFLAIEFQILDEFVSQWRVRNIFLR